jgi:drug/metabolite transporter (DMT)-like permease
MSIFVFFAALASALLHAIWNALARGRPDPGFGFAAIVVGAGVLSLPMLAVSGWPAWESWPYVALASAINMISMRLTMAAYRRLPFTLAYPLSRGSIPLAVLMLDVLLLGHEAPSPIVLGGVATVSLAIFLLTRTAKPGDRLDGRGLVLTLGAGLATASIIVTDSVAVKISGNVLGYSAVVAIVNAVLLPIMMIMEGVSPRRLLRNNLRFGLFGSLFSMASYILILLAFNEGPTAPAAAIRETSVLFGAFLGALLLRERPGLLRIGAIGLACFGMACIRLG